MARGWRIAAGVAGGLLVLAAAGLFFLERSITAEAHRMGDIAARDFGGERSRALVTLIECGPCNLPDRNRAVWALGQIEDARALPVLEKLRTGQRCDHPRRLCEYELDKAIGKIKGTNGLRPLAARVREAAGFRR